MKFYVYKKFGKYNDYDDIERILIFLIVIKYNIRIF